MCATVRLCDTYNPSQVMPKKFKSASKKQQITFPMEMWKFIQKRIDQLGFSVPEYIRFLVAGDKSEMEYGIPYVDEETERDIGKALEDVKAGRVTSLKSKKEISDHLRKLTNEALQD